MKSFPLTLAVCAAAIVLYYLPVPKESLVLTRSALFTGEIWTIFTNHFIHVSAGHLFYDVVGVLISGYLVETFTNWRVLMILLFAIMLATGGIYVVFNPISGVVGLSGLGQGLFGAAIVCLAWKGSRALALGLGIICFAKVGGELMDFSFARFLFGTFGNHDLRNIAVECHASGMITGFVVMWLWFVKQSGWRRWTPGPEVLKKTP